MLIIHDKLDQNKLPKSIISTFHNYRFQVKFINMILCDILFATSNISVLRIKMVVIQFIIK